MCHYKQCSCLLLSSLVFRFTLILNYLVSLFFVLKVERTSPVVSSTLPILPSLYTSLPFYFLQSFTTFIILLFFSICPSLFLFILLFPVFSSFTLFLYSFFFLPSRFLSTSCFFNDESIVLIV